MWIRRALLGLALCGLSGLSAAGCRGAPWPSVRYVGWVEPLEVTGGVLALPFTLLFDAATVGSFGLSWITLTFANPCCNAIAYDHSDVGFLERGVVVEVQRIQGQLDAAPETVSAAAASWLEAKGWKPETSSEGVETHWLASDQRHVRIVLELEQLSPWRSAFLLRLEAAGDVRQWTDEGDTWRARARLGELRQAEEARKAWEKRMEDEGYDPFDPYAPPPPPEPESKVDAGFDRAVDPLPDHEWELLDRIFLRERELTRERLLEATPAELSPLWEVLRAELGGSRLGE